MSHAPILGPAEEPALIAAWHSPHKLSRLAEDFMVSESTVYSAFIRLQSAGKLPKRQRTHVRVGLGEPRRKYETMQAQDEPATYESYLEECTAAFLMLLRGAHPEGPRYDIYPGAR